MASWACTKCTFLNPPNHGFSCQMCLNPHSLPSSSSSSSRGGEGWACKACTFLNTSDQSTTCQICDTPCAPPSPKTYRSDSGQLDDDSFSDDFLSSRKRKAPVEVVEPHSELLVEVSAVPSSRGQEDPSEPLPDTNSLLGKLHAERLSRMPKEVTPNIYHIFQQSMWWQKYQCSVSNELAAERPYFCMQLSRLPVKSFLCESFRNSIMGRELCVADIDAGMGRHLVVATTHLESPCPAPPSWNQMYSPERRTQAEESLQLLKDHPNVIFAGDMNWDEKIDGEFPLSNDWIDAWTELRPRENGWTYDTKANQMLSENRALQKRLDRFVCNMRDFKLSSIDMIGTKAIPGISYFKEKKVRKQMQKITLPVLPSDHYGLLLKICRKSGALTKR
ncbi:hypothetical protein AMTRI_Chr02g215780 [Amborella trichopoda]